MLYLLRIGLLSSSSVSTVTEQFPYPSFLLLAVLKQDKNKMQISQ